MTQVARNLEEVRKRIAAAARKAGRDPAVVRLVAVSKTVDTERIRDALAAGQKIFGENYLQETRGKIEALGPGAQWHFIGYLQTNKAKAVVALSHLIHSVDRLGLAQALEKAAAQLGKVQEILLQVNLTGEEIKSGAPPEAVPELLQETVRLPHLRVMGLMTMPPPWLDATEAVRPYFRSLRELRNRLLQHNICPLPELSMGMSGDFETAIEEGATLVRVGTAIFGRRGRDTTGLP